MARSTADLANALFLLASEDPARRSRSGLYDRVAESQILEDFDLLVDSCKGFVLSFPDEGFVLGLELRRLS